MSSRCHIQWGIRAWYSRVSRSLHIKEGILHMVPHGFTRLHMAPHGFTRFHMAPHGFTRFHMAPHGSKRFQNVPNGSTQLGEVSRSLYAKELLWYNNYLGATEHQRSSFICFKTYFYWGHGQLGWLINLCIPFHVEQQIRQLGREYLVWHSYILSPYGSRRYQTTWYMMSPKTKLGGEDICPKQLNLLYLWLHVAFYHKQPFYHMNHMYL